MSSQGMWEREPSMVLWPPLDWESGVFWVQSRLWTKQSPQWLQGPAGITCGTNTVRTVVSCLGINSNDVSALCFSQYDSQYKDLGTLMQVQRWTGTWTGLELYDCAVSGRKVKLHFSRTTVADSVLQEHTCGHVFVSAEGRRWGWTSWHTSHSFVWKVLFSIMSTMLF